MRAAALMLRAGEGVHAIRIGDKLMIREEIADMLEALAVGAKVELVPIRRFSFFRWIREFFNRDPNRIAQ